MAVILKLKKIVFYLCHTMKRLSQFLNQIFLDFEKTKIYWMNWCHKTPKFKNYNSEILSIKAFNF